MSHLSPDTFVDLLDGTLSDASVPHLESCEACRRQLSGLRITWDAAAAVEAPEPSPLFWDHFSARVREAVSTEPLARGSRIFEHWRMAVVAAGAAAVLVVAALGPLRPASVSRESISPERAAVAVAPVPAADSLLEDDSLSFVADLASNINWDSAADAGLTAHGDADRVLADMDAGERAELRRLLAEALGDRKI